MNQLWIYMCSPSRSPLLPPSPSHPSGSSQCTSPEHPSHASNLGWWSVSPLIVYLFQCCSLRTSHPCLLPQSPKVCSVHMCLFSCFAYWVIITIFLIFFIFSSLRKYWGKMYFIFELFCFLELPNFVLLQMKLFYICLVFNSVLFEVVSQGYIFIISYYDLVVKPCCCLVTKLCPTLFQPHGL